MEVDETVTPIVERALAPAFQGVSYDDRKVSLDRYRGRLNVLLVLMRGLG